MAIILIDRNVISTCEQILRSREKPLSQELAYRKKRLKELDSYKNMISPLLSIIEGSHGIDETKEQKLKTLEHEISIVNKFFKKAESDSKFFQNNKERTAEVFTENYTEQNSPNYRKFISAMYPILIDITPRHKIDDKMDNILKIAIDLGVDPGHIVVISAIAVLHGNTIVREIFKFKQNLNQEEIEKKAYNVYSDLSVVSKVNSLQAMYHRNNQVGKIVFFSFDKRLNAFINFLIVNRTNMEMYSDGSSSTEFNISYQNLFGFIDETQQLDIEKKTLESQEKFMQLTFQ